MPFSIVSPVKQGARETPDKYLPTAQVIFLFFIFYFLFFFLFVCLFVCL